VSQVITESLDALDMRFPELDAGREQKLASFRAALLP
jgi:hypothetical protein